MTAHTLPKNPYYAFSPADDLDNDLQQIRIVVDDMTATSPPPLPRTVHARRERRTGQRDVH